MNITFSASLNGTCKHESVIFFIFLWTWIFSSYLYHWLICHWGLLLHRSQRSKECPICWQLFVLRDPASQELLAAVEKERLLKTRNISSSSPISIHHSHDDFHSEEEESQFSSFDEQFLRHLTEAAHRRCLLRRRDGQISSSLVSSSDPTTIHPTDLVNLYRLSAISHVEHQNSNPCPSPGSMTPSPVSGHSSIPADSNNGSRYWHTHNQVWFIDNELSWFIRFPFACAVSITSFHDLYGFHLLELHNADALILPVSLSYWDYRLLINNLDGSGILDHVSLLCSYFLENWSSL
jgi:hypothetical protein